MQVRDEHPYGDWDEDDPESCEEVLDDRTAKESRRDRKMERLELQLRAEIAAEEAEVRRCDRAQTAADEARFDALCLQVEGRYQALGCSFCIEQDGVTLTIRLDRGWNLEQNPFIFGFLDDREGRGLTGFVVNEGPRNAEGVNVDDVDAVVTLLADLVDEQLEAEEPTDE